MRNITKSMKAKLFFLFKMAAVSVLVCGCSSESDDIEKKRVRLSYVAVKGADTAVLKLVVTGSQFKGQYEVNYHSSFKDSGDVKGVIKGDTLLGDYNFQHYGMEKWDRVPITFLKRDGKLILGAGTVETYFSKSYFKAGTQVDYSDPKFVFLKID
ncbi:hypothetical protein H7F33_20580 [Pedobacter sp. PAMC26386]|nr:hypothetical protein H7F33_20580 [Pedobacter sp. PAMC26386]